MLRTASAKTNERIIRRAVLCFLTSMVVLLLILPGFAGDKEKDEDTLQQANLVLQGFLNDKSISPTVLSKADCVLILPGVKKFGFGVGGSGVTRTGVRREIVPPCRTRNCCDGRGHAAA